MNAGKKYAGLEVAILKFCPHGFLGRSKHLRQRALNSTRSIISALQPRYRIETSKICVLPPGRICVLIFSHRGQKFGVRVCAPESDMQAWLARLRKTGPPKKSAPCPPRILRFLAGSTALLCSDPASYLAQSPAGPKNRV